MLTEGYNHTNLAAATHTKPRSRRRIYCSLSHIVDSLICSCHVVRMQYDDEPPATLQSVMRLRHGAYSENMWKSGLMLLS